MVALFLATTSLLLASSKWDPSIEAFEKQDQTTPPPKDAVLFVGSSSIVLWKTLETDFPGVPVLNRGFGGSTIPEVNEYVERIVWPYAPRAIVFYAGDNDIAGNTAPEKVLKDYQAFVAKAREKLPQTPIIFLSIKPSPMRAALLPAQQDANRLIRDYIATDKSQTFIDVATPLLDQDGQPNKKLFVEDGIHMTPEAYALWRDILRPHIKPVAQ